jgi:predicted secreted protein
MALAGHAIKVSCADTDVAGDEIDGIKNIDWGPAANLIETTDFMDTSGARTRLLGLKDLNVSVSGDYEASDAGQARLRTNFAAGTTTYVRFLPNGTVGFKCATLVSEFKITGEVDGVIQFSATLLGNGAIGTV